MIQSFQTLSNALITIQVTANFVTNVDISISSPFAAKMFVEIKTATKDTQKHAEMEILVGSMFYRLVHINIELKLSKEKKAKIIL